MRRVLRIFAVALLAAGPMPVGAQPTPEADPLERFNRSIFWFNEQADRFVLEPVARAWNWLLPAPVQRSLSRFFRNLETPTLVVNNLLQGKPHQAAIDVTRFAFNSTFGVAGFFDPAEAWGLARVDEDFGQTLGVWGVPPGPYLVVPLMGPATVRDAGARGVDYVTAVYPLFVSGFDTVGLTVADTVNWRAQSLDQIADLRAASLDFYVAVRNAYLQRRAALVRDGADIDVGDDDDLYFWDEDDE